MKNSICFILFFISLIGFSQENPVSIQADTTNIRIGEQIHYRIIVSEKDNVFFSDLKLDSTGLMEIVTSKPIDTLKDRLEKRYLLTSFDSGVFLIPKQEISINNKKFFTDSLLVNVANIKVDTTKQKMFPIKSIKREPKTIDDYRHLWWVLIPILLIIVTVLYLLLRKKVKKEAVRVYIPPIKEAFNRLKALDEKKLLQQNKVKAYYTELTDIVRTYIEKDTKIPALESTTNELVETIIDFNESSNLGIAPETIKELKAVLSGADLVKFAKWKPEHVEIKSDRNSVEEILKSTQAAMHKRAEETKKESGIDELFNNSEISPIRVAEKKVSFFKKYRLLLLILIAILLVIVGYFSFSAIRKDSTSVSTSEEIYLEPWAVSPYGYPTITLETPEMMKIASVQLPTNAYTNIGDYARYIYGNIGNGLFVSAEATKFFEEIENISLDEGVDIALKALESNYGIEFKDIVKENEKNNGHNGRKVSANFKTVNTANNKSERNNMDLLLFADKEGYRQVFVTYNFKNKEDEQRSKRVINSLEIN